MSKDWVSFDFKASWFGLAGVVLLFLGGWYGWSYLEAQSYNRLTGSQVTTWDAMFVDLRVQAEPTNGKPSK